MALFEDLFKMEGAAGPAALGLGAVLLGPTLLRILRPVAKELIKTGIVIYDEARGAVSEAYEAAGNVVAEARAERDDEVEAHSREEETPHRTVRTHAPHHEPRARPAH
ncbi:DUF5132 domain-containing protein [Methylocystis echinoides]|uniref:DUF5132 domain-containing protein n=1 Tax=Methylocystis echinoides TaxID=29468 RepID=UPI00343E967A